MAEYIFKFAVRFPDLGSGPKLESHEIIAMKDFRDPRVWLSRKSF